MRIKKYQNLKLNNYNLNHTPIHQPSLQSQNFSLSQLLSTPKKTQYRHHETQYALTNPHITNLNHRILNKKDIQINHNIFRINQKTQRQQNIKNKIKQRIKQEYMNDTFNIGTNRSFFGNTTTKIIDTMGSSFDLSAKHEPKDVSVHVKGQSVPISSFCRNRRSKSTVIRNGLSNFVQTSKLTNMSKIKSKQNSSRKKRVFSVEMKRQNSQTLDSRFRLSEQQNNKIFLKDIKPWEFDDSPQFLDL